MNEFESIEKYFAPLAHPQTALGLKDDAAVLGVPGGFELVVTTDALVAGVHFTGREPPGLIAQKALRVNLSDLAAMGAKPYGYFLALMLPKSTDATWLAGFAQGLACDQKTYGIRLMGGDTTVAPSPLCLSITMLGLVPQGTALTRSGARAGDGVYVTGTIGDGAMGLDVAQKKSRANAAERLLLGRYQLPQPRVSVGQRLRGIATACIDISDGLVQDLEHICKGSKAGAEIVFAQVPVSQDARVKKPSPQTILAGGDDYELLFTAPASAAAKLKKISKETKTSITCIGRITGAKTVRVLDAEGSVMRLSRKGYQHF